MLREVREYRFWDLELINPDCDFRVNLYRKSAVVDENGVVDPKNDKTNDTKNNANATLALRLICEDPAITQRELKEKMQASLSLTLS